MDMLAGLLRRENDTINNNSITTPSALVEPPSEPDDRLVHLMKSKLPQELVDQIEEAVYQLAFCPGVVFIPQQRPHKNTIEWRGRTYYAAKPELLTLSRNIHLRWHKRLWTENTYVFGTESPAFMRKFYDDLIAGKVCKNIQSVHIAFTFRDFGNRLSRYPPSIRGLLRFSGDTYNQWRNPRDCSRVDLLVKDLTATWILEYVTFMNLRLTQLTLDFSECYWSDGRFLGFRLLKWSLFPYFGLPSDLKVVAPDIETKEKILQVLRPNGAG
ncbi:MAG: hypothetical protein Q9225_006702 [Loekoesia sp. 1 TL-2023]